MVEVWKWMKDIEQEAVNLYSLSNLKASALY